MSNCCMSIEKSSGATPLHTYEFMPVCTTHLDHDVVTGGSLLGFIHPTLHHIVAHLHHVLNTHKQKGLYSSPAMICYTITQFYLSYTAAENKENNLKIRLNLKTSFWI